MKETAVFVAVIAAIPTLGGLAAGGLLGAGVGLAAGVIFGGIATAATK